MKYNKYEVINIERPRALQSMIAFFYTRPRVGEITHRRGLNLAVI